MAAIPTSAATAASSSAAKAKAKAKKAKKLTAADGVVVAPANLKTIGTVTCARIGGVWRVGTLAKTGRFQSYTLQASTAKKAAAKVTGKKRKALLKKADRFTKLSITQKPLCKSKLNTAGTAPAQPGGYIYPAPLPVSQQTSAPVRFSLANAIGVASGTNLATTSGASTRSLRAAPTTVTSGLAAIDAGGNVKDAVVSGQAYVGQFLIAPNNRLYVVFGSQTYLDGYSSTAKPCLLAEVERASGAPTCIEDGLQGIAWNQSYQGSNNPAIQFDASGAIYYQGVTFEGKSVLRRSSRGVKTNLVTDFAYANDFVVLPDGTVVLTGSTTATNASWVRRIKPAGSLSTLQSTSSNFLRVFPDGNVYMGLYSGGYGVLRYVAADDAMDSRAWIASASPKYVCQQSSYYDNCGYGYDENGNPNPAPAPQEDPAAPRNNSYALCQDYSANQGFCGSNGASIQKSFTTADGKVYVINGYGAQGQLMQYYPTLARPTSEIAKVAVSEGDADSIVLSGLDAKDKNVTTLYSTKDDTERELIGPDREMELYHVDYVGTSGKVLFDGLRFSDNSYVLGQVDLKTGVVSADTPLASRLTALETFK